MVLVLYERDDFSLECSTRHYSCATYELEKGCIGHDAPFFILVSPGELP